MPVRVREQHVAMIFRQADSDMIDQRGFPRYAPEQRATASYEETQWGQHKIGP